MTLNAQDLEDPKKIQELREKARSVFHTIIDPGNLSTLENIVERWDSSPDSIALQETIRSYKRIQSRLEAFPPEQQVQLMQLLEEISEEVFLSACTYKAYDPSFEEDMKE